MLEVMKFILDIVLEFISMLFTIDVGFTNLGTLMCILYIFLPIMLVIVNFFKRQLVEEFDDHYDNRYKKVSIFKYKGKHEKKPYRGKHEKS